MVVYKTAAGRVFDIFNYLLMLVMCVLMVYPFWTSMVLSLSPTGHEREFIQRLLPKHFTINAYLNVFKDGLILSAYYNTIVRTTIGTLLTVIITVCAAYPLSKREFRLRKVFIIYLLFTSFFQGGIIPDFWLMRSLHLNNTVWSLILPFLCDGMTIVMVYTFIRSIPQSLEESALIDGANEIVLLFRIVVPIAAPILATVALYTAVAHWNDWFYALIYITDKKKTVLQIILRWLIIENNTALLTGGRRFRNRPANQDAIKFATLMVSIGPIIFINPYAQKYFMKGMTMGAVKE